MAGNRKIRTGKTYRRFPVLILPIPDNFTRQMQKFSLPDPVGPFAGTLGDIPVMTKMILYRGKASGRYLLTMALSLLVHLPEFTPSDLACIPFMSTKPAI